MEPCGLNWTAFDLYRSGTRSTSRFDRPRTWATTPNARRFDIEPFDVGGILYVPAGKGGISTNRAPVADLDGVWWRLPSGTPFGEALALMEDRPGHLLWEPAYEMPLSAYVRALRGIVPYFRLA